MRYIFDFDRTLFATEALYEAVAARQLPTEWTTPAVWDTLDAASFLYDDTIPFLSLREPADVVILTAWDPPLGPQAYEFQRTKVERSGITKFVSDVIIMDGDKGAWVKKLYDGTPTVFVDDKLGHLLSAKAMCPAVQVMQMVRPANVGLPTHESIPVVTDLAELEQVRTL